MDTKLTKEPSSESQSANSVGREALMAWQNIINQNVYLCDKDFIHTIQFYFKNNFKKINHDLEQFGNLIPTLLEPFVAENHLPFNLPRLENYNKLGERIDKIKHHPSYILAGDIIYSTKLLENLTKPGGLLECLSLFFLSSEAGEAGHNCPIACSAGMIRVLQKIPDFPHKALYLEKLISPSYQSNFTGAQFVTEIQGGSDVGLNTVFAEQHDDTWQITGEKWFCSNANADLFFVTARFDKTLSGTKGLGFFLVPAMWNGEKNHYSIRRLKDKLGTRSMATAEIDFHGAHAYSMGPVKESFHLLMENVLHISRLFNTFCVLGMARRSYTIALNYARNRVAFSKNIIDYPLITESLARIKAENSALLAGAYAAAYLQDEVDAGKLVKQEYSLLLRLLVNALKYLSAKWSVDHIHHSLDILAGNGTIETFSSIPRLFRDSIVCENWEGTHNILHMQILKDIQKYHIEEIFLTYMNDRIEELNGLSPYLDFLREKLNSIKKFAKDFVNFDVDIQALQIKNLVDQMIILYCALCLLVEAIDQLKTENSSSKLDCFQYFIMLHVSDESILYNEEYLELIKRIATVA